MLRQTGGLGIVKVGTLPKFFLNTIPTDTPTHFSAEIDYLSLKLIWKCERPRRARTILKHNSNAGGLTLPSNWMMQLWPRMDMQISGVEPPVQK